ncbi:MAG: SH3 domain-containing protein [Deltaproteobacteria bacterium]|nr:SH3 domain-containing protein [Deltaproteobacteria bacterium]
MLVPVAVAVVALLVVVRSDWRSPVPRDGARAVQTSNVLRVAAAQAEVHARPAMQQPVIATLQRGAQVTVADESGDWYLVVLPDGTRGWIDRRAFE